VPNGFNSNGQVNLDYLTDFYHCFEDLEKIYIAVDQDQAGENGKKELVRRFGAEKVLIIDLEDCKDANEYLQRHGSEKLAKTLDSATLFPIENVLRVTDIESDLDEFYKNGSKKGYTIGLQEFDSIFSTYTKQFIVVTGFPSSGKSDFVDQMTIGYNMMHGWKTAYASTENVPHYLHVDKLVRKLYGSTPSYEDTKQVAWKKCLKHVNDNFFFIDYEDGFDLDKILRKGEELVKRMGIRCLVIDPYNKIRDKANLSLSITDYTNQYLNKIDDFCKKNDVVTILVAHPTKPQSDKGKLIEPTFYDVKGGGEFYDMSPHGLLVHRNYEENTVMIKVLKVKFGNLGENQAKVDFMWNVNNGRYTKIRHGEPDWDNENWLSDIKNPFKAAKALDFGLNEAKKLTF
jgi:twinkle protein